MTTIGIGVAAIAAASIVALALPATAAARGFGGSGGVHVGSAVHFSGGGGGVRSFGGAPMHSFAPSFSRPAFSPGAIHTFSRPTFSTGAVHSFARPGFVAGPIGFRSVSRRMTVHGSRSIAGLHAGWHGWSGRRHGMSSIHSASRAAGIHNAGSVANARSAWAARSWRARAATAGLTTGAAFAHAGGAHWMNGGRWLNHADWHRHRGFFGWVGPVFWPWFYDDLYDCVFWDYGPYYYEDPFWAYGYGDIYGAIFSPYGYGELADWAPAPAPRPRGTVAHRNTPEELGVTNPASPPPQWSAMCGDDARKVANLPIDRISAAVSPDDKQRAALDALADASVQAAQAIKTACPTDVAHTPTGRLDAMERRVDAMVQAVALIRPPLESFYGLLSDEQKARFNAIGHESRERRGAPASAQTCGTSALIPEWPQAQIVTLLQPSDGQRVLLDRLRDATQQAADMLKAACPAEPPASPPARLAALAARLDTMLKAVRLVHTALNDFYNSLSDEQKAQFNGIPPVVQVNQPKG
ncbi:MAG TPA: Spy/CpxP family protein refolding chaperone [Xanthobacteraceae bacterium]|nr:Spy/CpxP family protein refolding chaperone [Xanthobacteraceae bacterium]